MRWTTGLGIAVGGTSGALVALLGAPRAAPVANVAAAASPSGASPIAKVPQLGSAASAPSPSAPALGAHGLAAASTAPLAASNASEPAASATPAPSGSSAPSLPDAGPPDVPTTREALLKAMLYCDQRQDFDACAGAAVALDTGSAGPPDAQQAKRFRKIALTHLVSQCESGSPRACVVLATKYRAGTELPENPRSADALLERAAELCRLRPSADCPRP